MNNGKSTQALFVQFFSRFLIVMYSFITGLAILLSPKGYQKILVDGYTNFSYSIHGTYLESFFFPPSLILLHTYFITIISGLLLVLTSIFTIFNNLPSKSLLIFLIFLTILFIHNPLIHSIPQENSFHSLMFFLDLGQISGLFLI